MVVVWSIDVEYRVWGYRIWVYGIESASTSARMNEME
jgi:hypothetical protein